MDQLFEAFGINGSLLLAQLVNFGVLFVGLMYLLYKPVMKTLDERRAKIAKGVEDAALAEEKLQAADADAAQTRKSAEGEAEQIVSDARDAATTEKTRIVKDAESRAAQITKDAEARAEETAAKALRESEKEIARLAMLAAEKALVEST